MARADHGYRLGIDVGGTFTDLFLVHEATGSIRHAKVRSTPDDPSRAVLQGMDEVLGDEGITAESLNFFAHGTTVATNILLEHNGGRTGLLTTAGFRDLLELGRQKRAHLYDLNVAKPPTLVPRNMIEEIDERMRFDGYPSKPVDTEQVLQALEKLIGERGADAICICFLHSYVNPAHERAVAQVARDRFPDAYISVSSEILPEFREYERLATTVINSYIGPACSDYIGRLGQGLESRRIGCLPRISASNGGVTSFQAAANKPVSIISSGPAAGIAGAAYIGGLDGYRDLLTMDIGGTSVDVSLVRDGQPTMTNQTEVAGLPVKSSMIDVQSVGAGGGSIGWVDNGLLKVGPRSAGAHPGPACYGLGGSEPTVTDAHVVLGNIGPESLLGGRVGIDKGLAEDAIRRRLAGPLGISVSEAAYGLIKVMEVNLVRALRRVSVERGEDPRAFTLVAFGGAGPLHGAGVATELGMHQVIIPEHPGVLCATGLLATDVRRDFATTHIVPLDHPRAVDRVGQIKADLGEQAAAWLEGESVSPTARRIEYAVDARYRGQNHEITLQLDADPLGSQSPADIAESFHKEHDRTYGHRAPNETVEIVTFRATGIGEVAALPTSSGATTPAEARNVADVRPIRVSRTETVDARIFDRTQLKEGQNILGPALINQMDSTVLVPPAWAAAVLPSGNILLKMER